MELLTEADELLTRMEAVEQRCQTALEVVDDYRAKLKTAREVYDTALAELRALARVRKEEHPLFDAAKPIENEVEADTDTEDDLSANGDDHAAEIRKLKKDGWGQEAIAAELRISRRQVRKVLEK